VTAAATLVEALAPFRADPARSAILLDVDGTLAPIVRHASDAHVPEATRALLIGIEHRYGTVACVSGRQASDARRIVSIGSFTYVGSHGAELLLPGAMEPTVDPEVASWTPRVQAFTAEQSPQALHRLRVRVEDKGVMTAFHWRGAPDEAAAEAVVREIAERAEEAGLAPHWGRKVLEVRPPVRIDKGVGLVTLLRDADVEHALYIGDDNTDLDAFRGLDELVEAGRLTTALRIGVRSDEGPSELADAADLLVDGPAGVRAVLEALLEA
jgi:trehalose 6-phosphate phosphatase